MKHQIGFSEHHLIKVIYNSLLAMSFIHLSNVMHRDIKPANILLNANCTVKVCDFGLARSMPESATTDHNACNTISLRSQTSSSAQLANKLLDDRPRRKNQKRFMSLHVGSRWYRAPEISIIEKQYDQASDLWSFGCILYELLMYLTHQSQEPAIFEKKFQDIRFLFQGDSCFPLSPSKKDKGAGSEDKSGKKSNVVSKND
jgi:mitogen-activated protein kinase 1/3